MRTEPATSVVAGRTSKLTLHTADKSVLLIVLGPRNVTSIRLGIDFSGSFFRPDRSSSHSGTSSVIVRQPTIPIACLSEVATCAGKH